MSLNQRFISLTLHANLLSGKKNKKSFTQTKQVKVIFFILDHQAVHNELS